MIFGTKPPPCGFIFSFGDYYVRIIYTNRSKPSPLWCAVFVGIIAGLISAFVKWGAEHPFPPRSPMDLFVTACTDPSQALEVCSRAFLNPPHVFLRDYIGINPTEAVFTFADHGFNWIGDCLKILEDFYTNISEVTTDDLRHYWVFLTSNASFKSKLGKQSDFIEGLKKRGYKLVECELVSLEN